MTINKLQLRGFTKVPNMIVLGEIKLSDAEQRLYTNLVHRTYQKRTCFPGRQRIAKDLSWSISKVDRVKKTLIEKQLITKTRRGQGATNIYEVVKFFSEADRSQPSSFNKANTTDKEEEVKEKKLNNYLDNQTSNVKTSINREQTKNQKILETPNYIILRSMINKFNKTNEKKLNEAGLFDVDFRLATDLICYYFRRYKDVCGVEHPNYKMPQLEDCYVNLLNHIYDLKSEGCSSEKVSNVIKDVIERWFATTNLSVNNLRLSHFVGGEDNEIFDRCLHNLGFTQNFKSKI